MANAPSINIDPIKYIQSIEEFNGNHKNLYAFISLIDRIHPFIEVYNAPSQLILMDLIKSRLKGRAREVIEINCQATSWTTIKEILLNNFGERRSCDDLFEDLRGTTFKTNSIDFFNEIKEKLRNLNNKTLVVIGSGTAAYISCENNRKTALNTFKSKIPEPMKTILACRDPKSLEEAIDILCQSGYSNLNPFPSSSNSKTTNMQRPNAVQRQTANYNKNASNPNQTYNNQRKNNGQSRYSTNTNYFHSHPNHSYQPNVHNNQVRPQNANYPNTYNQHNSGPNNYPNLQYNHVPHEPRPEPMDVNNNEFKHVANFQNPSNPQNFQYPASSGNYHI